MVSLMDGLVWVGGDGKGNGGEGIRGSRDDSGVSGDDDGDGGVGAEAYSAMSASADAAHIGGVWDCRLVGPSKCIVILVDGDTGQQQPGDRADPQYVPHRQLLPSTLGTLDQVHSLVKVGAQDQARSSVMVVPTLKVAVPP
ncbi:hypothetical protein Tco_0367994 [Tanacetum coccineum]